MHEIKLDIKTWHDRLSYNKDQLKTITEKNYPALYSYFHDWDKRQHRYTKSSLRVTYDAIYKYLQGDTIKDNIVDHQNYVFFLWTDRLTGRVRKRGQSATGTSNRHINLLAALGYFPKWNRITEVNRAFMADTDSRRYMNFFRLPKLDDDYLRKCESTAQILKDCGVTVSNISYKKLYAVGLNEIADAVYLYNDREAPAKDLPKYEALIETIDKLIQEQGYCTRQDIVKNVRISRKQLARLYKDYSLQLGQRYYFKRPTKEQKKIFKLRKDSFIYTCKGDSE